MIEFSKVTKIYDSKINAVTDVSFDISEGEFLFLIGPSGSGKSTLIKMLIRDELPTFGKVFFRDNDITKISRRKVYKLRREVGVIFQDFKLVSEKTAYENVAFAMEAAGKNNREIKEAVPYVLDIVGLADRMTAFPKQLSGGEQQRVAIARAIANNPKILIADEPTGNLDPASSWDIVQILTKVNNWGTTVIMSTHGTDIVNALNKRVIQMDKGRIIRDDNKGQYELNSNFEENMQKENNADGEAAPEYEDKKEKRRFKLKLNSEETDSNAPTVNKPRRRFFGFFRRENSPKRSEIKDVLKDEISPNSFRLKKLHEYLQDEDENSNLNETNQINDLTEKKDTKVATEKQNSNFEKKPKKKKILVLGRSINELELSKPLLKKLKKGGFKNLEEIIQAGLDGLSERTTLDPNEIVQIADEIKRLTD